MLVSPPPLVHPCAPASILEVDSSSSSSGSGGAPGSPGLGRVDEVVEEDTAMLPLPSKETSFPLLGPDGRLSDPTMSEVEGLPSPSGWRSMVDSFENVLERSLIAPEVLML